MVHTMRLTFEASTCLLIVCSPVNPKNGRPSGMISKEIYDIIMENAETLDSAIIYDRDFHYN